MKKILNFKTKCIYILCLALVLNVTVRAQGPVSWNINYGVGDNTTPPPPTVGLKSIAYNPANNFIYVYGQKFFNLPAQPSGMVYTREAGVVCYSNTLGSIISSVYDVHHDNTTLIPSSDEAGEMVIAADGSVYVTGKRYYDATYLYDMVIIKYNSSLVEQWRYYGFSPGSADDAGIAITLDPAGNILATGQLGDNATGTGADFVTFKLRTDGTLGWFKVYNSSGNHTDTPTDITTDASGNVYVTGYSLSGSLGNQYALVKYDSTGNLLWSKNYNAVTTSAHDDKANAVVASNSGNVYITGTAENSAGNTDVATVAYNSAGTKLWVRKINNSGDSRDRGYAIKLDAAQNIYVGGDADKDISASVNGELIYRKYDPAGNALMTRRYSSGYNCEFGDLAVTSAGKTYITGWCLGATLPPSNGTYSLMTRKYTATGTVSWSDMLTPGQFVTCGEGFYGFKLAVNTVTSEAAVGGRHWQACPGAHPNEWSVRRYYPTLREAEEDALDNADQINMEVYPNPATADFTISLNNGLYDIRIINLHGQLVFESRDNSKATRVNSVEWAPGIYFVNVQSEGKQMFSKLVKN